MNEDCRRLVRELQDRLRGEDLHRAFLFGSWARGSASSESDVDLLLVLDRQTPFRDFSEKSAIVLDWRRQLQSISASRGLDLLVFTIPEWQEFLQEGSWFAKELQRDSFEVA